MSRNKSNDSYIVYLIFSQSRNVSLCEMVNVKWNVFAISLNIFISFALDSYIFFRFLLHLTFILVPINMRTRYDREKYFTNGTIWICDHIKWNDMNEGREKEQKKNEKNKILNGFWDRAKLWLKQISQCSQYFHQSHCFLLENCISSSFFFLLFISDISLPPMNKYLKANEWLNCWNFFFSFSNYSLNENRDEQKKCQ